MERRKHKTEDLPKKIRYYNLGLMSVIFVLVLVGYLGRDWIVLAIRQVVDWVRLAIGWIIRGIIYLIGLLGGEDGMSEVPVQDPMAPYLGPNDGYRFPYEIFVYLLILIVIIVYRKQIFGWISKKWESLITLIRNLLNKTRAGDELNLYNEYYYDKVETLPQQEREARAKRSYRFGQWKKDCRRFFKMKDSPEKLRLGYRLVIDRLQLEGVPVLPSDTTLTLLEKERSAFVQADFTAATREYNLVRYADGAVSRQSCEEMERAVEGVLALPVRRG